MIVDMLGIQKRKDEIDRECDELASERVELLERFETETDEWRRREILMFAFAAEMQIDRLLNERTELMRVEWQIAIKESRAGLN